eukprot:140603_1
MILSVEDTKRIVKEEMIGFTSEDTLNIMFEGFCKWIKDMKQHVTKDIEKPDFIANIVFHYPLKQLIQRIKRDKIDGKRFIEIGTRFVAQETGWTYEQVEQIQLVLMSYSAINNTEFTINMNSIFKQETIDDSITDQIPNDVISEIKAIIDEFDAEILQYNYKKKK